MRTKLPFALALLVQSLCLVTTSFAQSDSSATKARSTGSLSGILRRPSNKHHKFDLELDGHTGSFALTGQPLEGHHDGERVFVDGVIRTELLNAGSKEKSGDGATQWRVWMEVQRVRKVDYPFDIVDRDRPGVPYDPSFHEAWCTPPLASGLRHASQQIIVFPRSDASIDVCWREQGEAYPNIYVSRFHIERATARHLQTLTVPHDDLIRDGHLHYLAGFTEDESGNFFIARALRESIRSTVDSQLKPTPAQNGRTGVLRVTKLDPRGRLIRDWPKDFLREGGSEDLIYSPLASRGDEAAPYNTGQSVMAFMNVKVGSSVTPVNPNQPNENQPLAASPILLTAFAANTPYDPNLRSRHDASYWRVMDAETGQPIRDLNGLGVQNARDIRLLSQGEHPIFCQSSTQGIVVSAYTNKVPNQWAFPHDYWAPRQRQPADLMDLQDSDSYCELGDIVAVDRTSFLMLVAATKTQSNQRDNMWATAEIPVPEQLSDSEATRENAKARNLAIVRFSLNADSTDNADQGFSNVKISRGPIWLTDYQVRSRLDKSASRPKLIPIAENRFVVIWMEFDRKNENDWVYNSTMCMEIDQDGRIIVRPHACSTVPHSSADRLFRIDRDRIGWITGDATKMKLILHSLDDRLRYHAMDLIYELN